MTVIQRGRAIVWPGRLSKLMRDERTVRIVLMAALAVGAIGVAAEALASFDTLATGAGRPWRQSEIAVIRAQKLNPAVIERIATVIPRSAAYTVAVAPRLGRTDHGQAFTALLRGRLLPRVQVAAGRPAAWHVIWGAKVPSCCHVWDVGRIHPGEPPVMVVSDG